MVKRALLLLALFVAVLVPSTAQAQNRNDPCTFAARTNVAISNTASAIVIPGVAGVRTFVCFAFLVSADAKGISVVEGTGAVCATGTAAMIGGTTAATGPPMAANTQIAIGSGISTVTMTSTAGRDVCLLQSSAGILAGNMAYVRQ